MPIQIPGVSPGITISELRRIIEAFLAPQYGTGEARFMTGAILEEGLGMNRTALLSRADQQLGPVSLLNVTSMADRLNRGEPLQYVLGFVDWAGLRLHVGYGVLIPRPETEWILIRVLAETRHIPNPRLLDLCTGSGCIPLGYKHARPEAKAVGVDISEAALRWADVNRRHTGLEVAFTLADVLKDDFPGALAALSGTWHVITSNPPYVPASERSEMAAHVRDHEPDQALFVPDIDPLLFYRRIARLAAEELAPGGYLFLESHMDYTADVAQLLAVAGLRDVQIETDPYDRPRLVWARKA